MMYICCTLLRLVYSFLEPTFLAIGLLTHFFPKHVRTKHAFQKKVLIPILLNSSVGGFMHDLIMFIP